MKNDFTEKTRRLFEWNYLCFYCMRSGADALHHVVGRGYGNSKIENSPLNACPIHNEGGCHLYNYHLATFDTRRRLLWLVRDYLVKDQAYQLTEKDKLFIKKHKEYYKGYSERTKVLEIRYLK